MTLAIQPHGNHVLLHRFDAVTTSPGGIIIPETSCERPHRGVVLAVGGGLTRDDGACERPDVEPGDIVVYSQDYGTELRYRGVEVTLLKAEHIAAIVADEQDGAAGAVNHIETPRPHHE